MEKSINKGITLISLVITIVILIILASAAIYLILGNNGIFTIAKEAKELTNKQTATEKINLKITTAQINKYAEEQRMPTLKELSLVLKEDNEILYVTETSQVASTKKYEVGEKPSSIFTKLKDYPYEFEINGQLQLASIDRVKIANSNSNSKKEVLWRSDEIGVQSVKLEKNISDYDFIIVYYNSIWNSGEAIFDTLEPSYEKSFSYKDSEGAMYCSIMLNTDNNEIKMNLDFTSGEYTNQKYNYIKKVIGIKL